MGPEHELLRSVRRLHGAVDALLDAAADTYRVNRTDLRCLEILDREGPLSATRLAERARLSPAAVTKLLVRLRAAGFVRVEPSSSDRRSILSTSSGRHAELRESVWRPVVDGTARLAAALDPAELARVLDVLGSLSDVAEEGAARLRRDR
jgi:DNA-binding MarR family transcriptional regulator